MGLTINLRLKRNWINKTAAKWKQQFFCLQNQLSKEVHSQSNKFIALLICLRCKYWCKSAINNNLFFIFARNQSIIFFGQDMAIWQFIHFHMCTINKFLLLTLIFSNGSFTDAVVLFYSLHLWYVYKRWGRIPRLPPCLKKPKQYS